MTQYTDFPITFEVDGIDMTQVTQPHVTFRQGYIVIDVTDIYVSDSTHFTVLLTQAQTARFQPGYIQVQLNYFDGGERKASEVVEISASLNLLKRILSNG